MAEAGLYVIGVDDDVIRGIRDPEVVRPDKEFLVDGSEFALKF